MRNIIKTIEKGSVLDGRVKPGYALVSINGKPIRDVLDYKYYGYDSRLTLELLSPEGKLKLLRVKKREGEDLGLDFETYLMDRPRSCANKCVFCFIDQNPPGMRKSIYFKDDDARLSFLMGCYITLTNLSQREIERIIDLRISPVNISVHATDPELRREMLGSKRAGECLNIMGRFARAGITMNCQIVCCPGLNDGERLLRTMSDLKALFPAVNSVSVVPVGLTRHREGLPALRAFTPESAGETIDLVTQFGNKCVEELGTRLVFCADELYIRAGRELPPDSFYEAHTQLENGVGMLRLLESEFSLALAASEGADGVPFSLACGTAAAPYLEKLLCTAREKYDKLNGRVYPVVNRFFGESVTVSGLVTGGDLVEQLSGRELGERLFISADMLRRDEQDFLDSVTLAQAEQALGVPIYPVENDGGCLCDAFLGILPRRRVPVTGGEETEYYPYNQNRK